MGKSLLALAATLGVAGLAATSLAGAVVPSVNGPSSVGGGSMHGGGGGGAHGGGGYAGGHFSGGHFSAAARFSAGARSNGSGYRGGAYGGHGGYAAHTSFLAHGGYVSHGRAGYRIVGYQSAGLARAGAIPRVGHAARISLALGPRWGSAARATRIGGEARVDHLHPRPGHPWCPPGHPKHPHVHTVRPTMAYLPQSQPPMFCENVTFMPPGKRPYSGCLTPIKMKMIKAR